MSPGTQRNGRQTENPGMFRPISVQSQSALQACRTHGSHAPGTEYYATLVLDMSVDVPNLSEVRPACQTRNFSLIKATDMRADVQYTEGLAMLESNTGIISHSRVTQYTIRRGPRMSVGKYQWVTPVGQHDEYTNSTQEVIRSRAPRMPVGWHASQAVM